MARVADVRTEGPRQDRLLREAAVRLNARGISQTSLSAIAACAGISRAAIYYYVADQQDLVYQCYRRSCEHLSECLARARSSADHVLEAVEAFIDGVLVSAEPECAVLSEIAYLRPEQRDTILRLHGRIRAELSGVLEAGIASGQVRPLQSQIVAQAVIGLVSWIPIARRWPTSMRMSRRRLVDAVKVICLDGLAEQRLADFQYQPLVLAESSLPVRYLFDPDAVARGKQEAILAAASWQFNRKGIEATSLDEIAAAIGVTPKVIYHNLGDKETLVTGCYRRAFEFYLSIADRARQHDGSRLQAVCGAVHALAEATLREDVAPLTPLAGLDSAPPDVQREIQAAAAKLLGKHDALYRQGQAEGSIRRFDRRAVLSIRHATHEWLPKWYGDADAAVKAVIPRELADFARLGLRPL